MGCCCSSGASSASEDAAAETEMRAQNDAASKVLSMARAMSAPTLDVDGTQVSGHGLALAAVVIEQDAAYWEVHVALDQDHDGTVEAMFGVATKKDRKFYQAMEAATEPVDPGTALLRPLVVRHGDVIGVAVQQSDLPMIQLLLNGELQPNASVNRFRGTVHPAVALPESSSSSASLRLVFRDVEWTRAPPSSRFAPVMVARGLV